MSEKWITKFCRREANHCVPFKHVEPVRNSKTYGGVHHPNRLNAADEAYVSRNGFSQVNSDDRCDPFIENRSVGAGVKQAVDQLSSVGTNQSCSDYGP